MNDERQSGVSKIQKILRSDLLPKPVGLLEAFPSLRTVLPRVFQLGVVIDPHVVHGELYRRLKNRRKRDARSTLDEVFASGVMVVYAPHHLEGEIREHMEDLTLGAGHYPDKMSER